MNAFHLYLRLVAFSLRSQMTYRASFAFQVLGQFIVTSAEFLAIWALLDRFGQIEGWELSEICFFYGTVSIMFALADGLSRGFDQFGGMVRSGAFDRMLLRPRSTVLQLLGYELTLRRIGRLLQALLVLGLGAFWRPETVTVSNAFLLGWAVLGGIALFLGLMMLQATVCFWTVESIEMMNITTYGAVTTAQYPLSIYQEWLQKFFLFIVPLACVTYFPVVGILGRNMEAGVPLWASWLAPLAGTLFLIVAARVWHFGVRHYCSTGT